MQSRSLINRINNFSFLLEDIIGKGAAGKVYKGINQINGQQVAIKILEMSEIDNEVTQYLLVCQKEALLTIKCQYVLFAYEIIQNEHQCFIITPMCTGGTLKQYIQNKGKLQQHEAFNILLKLLYGYKSIKQKKFLHRDLKSSNIMFNKGNPIIIDFGYCQKTNGDKPKVFYNVGSPSYMSPQAYYKTIYSQKSDIWALGIILYQMLQGNTVDFGLGIDQYFVRIVREGVTFRGQFSEQCKRMMRDILNPNPGLRPGVEILIQRVEQFLSQNAGDIQNHQVRYIQSHSQPHFKPQSHPLPLSHNHHTQNFSYPFHPNVHHFSQHHFQNQHQPQTHQHQQNRHHHPQTMISANKIYRQDTIQQHSTPTLFKPMEKFEGFQRLSESIYRNGDTPQKANMQNSYEQKEQAQKIQQNRQVQLIQNRQSSFHIPSRNDLSNGKLTQKLPQNGHTQHQITPQFRHSLPVMNTNRNSIENQHIQFQVSNQNQHQHQHQHQPIEQKFPFQFLQPFQHMQQPEQMHTQNFLKHNFINNDQHINQNHFHYANYNQNQSQQYVHGQIHNQQIHPNIEQNTQNQNRPHSNISIPYQNNNQISTLQDPQLLFQNVHQSLILPSPSSPPFFSPNSLSFPVQKISSSSIFHPSQSPQTPQKVQVFIPLHCLANMNLIDSIHHSELDANSHNQNRTNGTMNQSNMFSHFNIKSSLQNNNTQAQSQNHLNNFIRNGQMVNSLIMNPQPNENIYQNRNLNFVHPVYRSFMDVSHQPNTNNNQYHQQQQGINHSEHRQNELQSQIQLPIERLQQQPQQFSQVDLNLEHQHNNLQIQIHSLGPHGKNRNRPFSPIAVQRKSMPVNSQYLESRQISPDSHHIQAQPEPQRQSQFQKGKINPQNFLKKAQPYFHMTNKNQQVPAVRKQKLPITRPLNPNRNIERKRIKTNPTLQNQVQRN